MDGIKIDIDEQGEVRELHNVQHTHTHSLIHTHTRTRTALFDERTQWTKEDLEPYLVDLMGPGISVASLLLKHSRSIAPADKDQPTMYSAR